MRESILIRPAQPADAERAAELLYSAYTHTQVAYPLTEDHDRAMIERLRDYYRREGNRFSYQNILVAEVSAQVVGLVLSFGGREEARLNAAVGNWLEREAADDEWYVDALAVFTNWGRQGIGARLLKAAEWQGRQRHYARVALHVAPGNTPAENLYAHRRYVAAQQAVLYGRPFVRMVKTLDAEEPERGTGATRVPPDATGE